MEIAVTAGQQCRSVPFSRLHEQENSVIGLRAPNQAMNGGMDQAIATGILPILVCHSLGPVLWTEMPLLSTATVTGMSLTSNS